MVLSCAALFQRFTFLQDLTKHSMATYLLLDKKDNICVYIKEKTLFLWKHGPNYNNLLATASRGWMDGWIYIYIYIH